MSEKKFTWLADKCSPRKGADLVRGGVYYAGDYPPEAVLAWIKTGAAEWTVEETSMKPEVRVVSKTKPGKKEQ